jgi:hypothetical protein
MISVMASQLGGWSANTRTATWIRMTTSQNTADRSVHHSMARRCTRCRGLRSRRVPVWVVGAVAVSAVRAGGPVCMERSWH